MTKLICIIGTDGSGKTTLADALAESLEAQGQSADRVWLGAESYLMAPVRKVLKVLWSRRKSGNSGPKAGPGSQRVDYAAEISRKNALAMRFAWAVRLYVALVWADYRLQLLLKLRKHRRADVIIADRYLFDVAVNLGLTLGWSPEAVVRFIQRRLGGTSLPVVRVFLRVEPEVSMSRKDDVFDIDYLRLRLRYYDAIAQAFGFTVRDGTLPITENAEWLLGNTQAESPKPYVLYVHSNNVDIGGADKVLKLMAEHMRDFGRPEKGCRVAVALRQPTAILEAYEKAGIPVILHPFERPQVSHGIRGLLRLALRAPISLWFFWGLFGRERPDIVHVNDLYDFLPALAAKLRGIPVVWHIRMIIQKEAMRSAFSRLIATLSPVSVSVSRAVRDHYFPNQSSKHSALVVHDLGNASLIADHRDPTIAGQRPAGLPVEGRLALMIGRVEPWKGQAVFVEAVSLLPQALKQAATFALVGGGVIGKEDYLETVTAKAKEAGILMLGERLDVPDLLRSADISVHASITPDPFPGVVIESLLSGAATIASASGGTVEMIENGRHGFLSRTGDAQALSDVLAQLLSDPATPRSRFGVAARTRALELVDANVVDQEIRAIYEKQLFKTRNSRLLGIQKENA